MSMMQQVPVAVASALGSDRADPANAVNRSIKRLASSVQRSYRRMEGGRKERREILSLYGGPYVNTVTGMPINLMHQMLTALMANIAAENPKAEVSPRTSAAMAGYGIMLAQHLTNRLMTLNYRDTERLVLLDALTLFGVVKVGVANAGYTLNYNGEEVDPGETYICRVSPDDYIIDCSARTRAEATFEGHRYRSTRDRLEMTLTPEEVDRVPRWAIRSADDTAEALTMPRNVLGSGDGDFVEWFDLIDLYIPAGVLSREALILTLPGDPQNCSDMFGAYGERPLIREADRYDGTSDGPYEVFGLNPIPDSTLFAAPAGMLRDLAQMTADLGRHVADADSTTKSLLMYKTGTPSNEVDSIRRAPSSAMVEVENPSNYVQTQMGGSTDRSQQSLGFYMTLFSQMSGSDLLSGNSINRGSRDVTATETQEVAGRLSVIVDSIEREFYEHGDRVIRKLAYYETQSPFLSAEMNLSSMGINIPVTLDYDTASRQDLLDYTMKITRGSMRRVSEGQQARNLLQWAANAPMVALQLAQAMGPGFDVVAFLEMTSDGMVDPAKVQRAFPAPQLMMQGMAQTQAAAQQAAQQAAGGGQDPVRRPGMPGGAIPGGAATGAASPAFDTQANTEATMRAMGS